MVAMWNNLDSICGGTSPVQIASYVGFVISIILLFITTPLTLSIAYALMMKSRYQLLTRNYFLVILNITIADTIMAIIAHPMSVSFHIKEALGPSVVRLPKIEQTVMHIVFFFTNIVAVLSMAVLALDRLGVILAPFSYYKNMTRIRIKMILACTWLSAIGITIVYLYIGYIRFLVVFSFSTVGLTLTLMIITMILLRRRLNLAKAYEVQQRRDSRASVAIGRRESNRPINHRQHSIHSRRRTETMLEFTPADQRITATFLWMLVLFVMNYVPCVILVLYMNICEECDCDFVHIMRDIIWFMILASPLCRALNFLVRLETLRETVQSAFKRSADRDSLSGFQLNDVMN